MTRKVMAIAYDYCTGCHTCEVSCKMEHSIPTGQWGIKVNEVGPWEYGKDLYQHDYVPVITAQCNGCADRVAKGKKPACVHNCFTNCMKFGTMDEVMEQIAADEERFGQQFKYVMYLMKD